MDMLIAAVSGLFGFLYALTSKKVGPLSKKVIKGCIISAISMAVFGSAHFVFEHGMEKLPELMLWLPMLVFFKYWYLLFLPTIILVPMIRHRG